MKKYWTLREERALSLLKAQNAEFTLSNMRDALQVVDNCRVANTRVKAKEHLGAYDNAKQDLTKYTPVLQTGPAPQEPDSLTQWLIQRRKGLR